MSTIKYRQQSVSKKNLTSLLIATVLALFLVSQCAVAASPGASLTKFPQTLQESKLSVANWSFEIVGAVKAPTLDNTVHLGLLEDGQEWLVVTFNATNTSDEKLGISSDKIQLQAGSETISQAGSETNNAAAEIGFATLDGSEIEPGASAKLLQVFKVEADATQFVLVFDFSGKWELPLNDALAASNEDPRYLLGAEAAASSSSSESSESAAQNDWVITTPQTQVSIIGASIAPTFTGSFHLGKLDDGRSWLVVSYRIKNTTNDKVTVESESIRILSAGEEVKQAGDETRSVAKELGLEAPSVEIESGAEPVLVQVFKVAPSAIDNTLQISSQGDWFINLRPLTDAAAGRADIVVPATALDLTTIEADNSVAQVVPTAAPTETPLPTAIPEAGSKDNPAGMTDTLVNGSFAVEISEVTSATSLAGGFDQPRGGFRYVIVTLLIANVGNSSSDYGQGDFVAIDPVSGDEYSSEWLNFADRPLEGGELGSGEYTYGQLVYEVGVNKDQLLIRFRPSLFGDESYWLVDLT